MTAQEQWCTDHTFTTTGEVYISINLSTFMSTVSMVSPVIQYRYRHILTKDNNRINHLLYPDLFSLSCHDRANTNNIVKFDLHTEREVTQIGLGGSVRKNSYGWGGYSGVDMAVDEQGLWVLWGYNGNSYRLIAYKIDVYKNTVTNTWNLNTGTTHKQPQ